MTHVVSPDGREAERLVCELIERLPDHGVETQSIYYRNQHGIEMAGAETEPSLGSNSVCEERRLF